MELISTKCPSCGGEMQLKGGREHYFCPYCGSKFLLKGNSNDSADFVIHAGVLEKYNGASLDVIIPDSVVKIGEKAFVGENWSGLAIQTVVFPKNLIEICSNAFTYCSLLKSIIIPDSVKSIGNNAFSGCKSVEKIYIPQHTIICDSSFKGVPNGPTWSIFDGDRTIPGKMSYREYLYRMKKTCPECQGTIVLKKQRFTTNYYYQCSGCGKVYPYSSR